MTDEIQTFTQQVESAATEANLPDEPVMTPEEEAIPAEQAKPVEPVAVEPEKPSPPQVVPLAVHIRQREKYERELQNIRQQTEIGNQRLQQLMETIAPPPAPVDRNTDPLGATLQEMDSLRGDIRETKAMLQQREQQEMMRSQLNSFQNAVISDEQQFIQQTKDYPDAVNFAKDMKFREYVALGLDQHQAAARVQQDAYALAQHALSQGVSAADMAYRMAQALGYRPGTAQKHTAAQDDELATSPVKSPAEQAVEMRQAGAQRGKTTGGAASTGGAMTFAELANLDNEEFAKMTSGKKWDRLFRGA